MKLALAIVLLCGMSVAYADQAPPAFRTDPSKPDALAQVNPNQPNTSPVSPGTNKAWKNYDSSLRECIAGDSVLPSNGHDMFSGLFHNSARIDITMSIQGWKKKDCAINFIEATNVMYCHFNDNELQQLMKAILNSDQYDASSPFAQLLNTNCTSMPPQQT